jgi:hypothetical protein
MERGRGAIRWRNADKYAVLTNGQLYRCGKRAINLPLIRSFEPKFSLVLLN